jgi:hypothetical protein
MDIKLLLTVGGTVFLAGEQAFDAPQRNFIRPLDLCTADRPASRFAHDLRLVSNLCVRLQAGWPWSTRAHRECVHAARRQVTLRCPISAPVGHHVHSCSDRFCSGQDSSGSNPDGSPRLDRFLRRGRSEWRPIAYQINALTKRYLAAALCAISPLSLW